MALAVVVATPLLARAIVFHDDLIIAFLVATTLYFGLAASSWHGWIATGIVAGGALSVKPLGVVALALVAVLLWSRRPSWRSGIAAACGFGVAVPWYLGNLVRLGDPVYPFLSTGTDNALRLIVEDHASYLANRNGDQLELLGSLALALLSVGLAVGLVYLLRRDRRLALGLVLLLAVYLVAWGRFDYGTRHLLVLYPVYASVAGLGLAVVPRLFVRRFAAATFVAVAAVWSLVVGVSVWNVYVERWGRTPFEERTGLYAMALGKWYGEQTLSAALDPPPDRQVFGEIGEFWSRLQHADPHARVLSFDTRAWYIPQRILSAGEDVEAVRIYLAGDADAQHAAILADGVRFVLARKAVDSKHRILYKLGPWRDLDRRPDLYRLLFRNRLGSLYEVLPG